MYGTSFFSSAVPELIVPLPPIEFVRGIVMVFVSVMAAFGKNLLMTILSISNGVGKPPKPDILVSGLWEIEGRTE